MTLINCAGSLLEELLCGIYLNMLKEENEKGWHTKKNVYMNHLNKSWLWEKMQRIQFSNCPSSSLLKQTNHTFISHCCLLCTSWREQSGNLLVNIKAALIKCLYIIIESVNSAKCKRFLKVMNNNHHPLKWSFSASFCSLFWCDVTCHVGNCR